MTHKLFSVGATGAAVILAAAFALAQGPAGPDQPGGPPSVQGQPPPAPGGRSPQQMGPRAGRGGPMAGRGRADRVGPQGPARGEGRGFAAMDLTDDQRTKIADLRNATRDQVAPLQDELVFTRRTLHREVFADRRDNAKVAALTTKVATLEKQLADLRVKTSTAVADLLTPAQRQTMRLMEGRRGQGRGPGGPGFGRGRGGFDGAGRGGGGNAQ